MSEKKTRIIFCRIGWAKYYDGRKNDIPVNGGAFNNENTGFEIYNFKEYSGMYYGYVRTQGRIHFEKIEKNYSDYAETMADVLVVWFAKNPSGGQFIVGWYENAILYKTRQGIPNSILEERDSEKKIFLAKTAKAILIPENKRTFKITGPGTNCIWYGNDVWKNKVLEYINNYSR